MNTITHVYWKYIILYLILFFCDWIIVWFMRKSDLIFSHRQLNTDTRYVLVWYIHRNYSWSEGTLIAISCLTNYYYYYYKQWNSRHIYIYIYIYCSSSIFRCILVFAVFAVAWSPWIFPANLNIHGIYVASSVCSMNVYTRKLIWAHLTAKISTCEK